LIKANKPSERASRSSNRNENIDKQSLQPEPKTLFALKRNYLPLSSPIAGDVQTRLVRQPNAAAAVGVHFINVSISEAAVEDKTL